MIEASVQVESRVEHVDCSGRYRHCVPSFMQATLNAFRTAMFSSTALVVIG
jgi:hypothetical protein